MLNKIIKCTHREKQAAVAATVLVLVLAGAYLTLLTKSVINVSIQKETENRIIEERSLLSQLESKYIESKNNINLKLAKSEGFQKPIEKVYTTADTLSKNTVTMNDDI